MGVVLRHQNWLEGQLSQRLWFMQQAGKLCDVIIHPAADAEQLQAHSAVLAAASPQIQELLQSMKEGYYSLRTATIPHHVWNYLLEFIYLGVVNVDEEHVADVRKIARKLDIKLEPSSAVATKDNGDVNSSNSGDEALYTASDLIVGNVSKDKAKYVNTNGTGGDHDADGEEKGPRVINYQAISSANCDNIQLMSSKAAEITDLVIPSEEDCSIKSSSSMHSLDFNPQMYAASATSSPPPANNNSQPEIKKSITSIIMKETSSRRRKSIVPRKIVQEEPQAAVSPVTVTPVTITPKPQVAEVQPTPITTNNTPPLPSSPTPSSQNSSEGTAIKKPRVEELVTNTPPTSLPLNLLPHLSESNNFLMAPFFNPQLLGAANQQLFASQFMPNQLPFYLPNPSPSAPAPPPPPPPPLPGMEASPSWGSLKLPTSFSGKAENYRLTKYQIRVISFKLQLINGWLSVCTSPQC